MILRNTLICLIIIVLSDYKSYSDQYNCDFCPTQQTIENDTLVDTTNYSSYLRLTGCVDRTQIKVDSINLEMSYFTANGEDVDLYFDKIINDLIKNTFNIVSKYPFNVYNIELMHPSCYKFNYNESLDSMPDPIAPEQFIYFTDTTSVSLIPCDTTICCKLNYELVSSNPDCFVVQWLSAYEVSSVDDCDQLDSNCLNVCNYNKLDFIRIQPNSGGE